MLTLLPTLACGQSYDAAIRAAVARNQHISGDFRIKTTSLGPSELERSQLSQTLQLSRHLLTIARTGCQPQVGAQILLCLVNQPELCPAYTPLLVLFRRFG